MFENSISLNLKKIYIVGDESRFKHYANWLTYSGMIFTKYIEEADLVLFTGGEDVNPKLYYHKRHQTTFCNDKRDFKEKLAYERALELEKPMLGICRGAQFLTVMNGGVLFQNVDNHAGKNHKITFYDNSIFEVNSLHHQMMWPYYMDIKDYQILGFANQITDFCLGTPEGELLENKEHNVDGYIPDAAYYTANSFDFMEPEVVYYPKSKSLCIQSHPELLSFNSEAVVKFRELVKNVLATVNNKNKHIEI